MFCSSLLFYLDYFFFFNDTATTEIYTLSLHDALPILALSVTFAGIGTLSGTLSLPAAALLYLSATCVTRDMQATAKTRDMIASAITRDERATANARDEQATATTRDEKAIAKTRS